MYPPQMVDYEEDQSLLSASDHVSKAQSGKYEYRRNTDYDTSYYHIYKGDRRAGRMDIQHFDDEGYDDYEPTQHKVALLQMAKGHGAAAMTALGIAQNRAAAEHNKLTPDTSLSPFSSRLVQNAQRRGLVTESRESGVSNYTTHMIPSDPMPPNQYRPGRRLNTEEVDAGRQTIRQMLGRGKPKSRPEQ